MGVDARDFGMLLLVAGLVLALAGLAVLTGAAGWFGRLPGDIRIEGDRLRLYLPITTMVLVSLLLTLLLNLLRKLF